MTRRCPTSRTKTMKTIQLSKGQVSLVDNEDVDFLSQWSWHASKSWGGRLYARRPYSGKGVPVYMHRVILNAKPDQSVDHANGNSLDNRRINLRLCEGSQNNANSKLAVNNTSGFKGVTFHKASGLWTVHIYHKQAVIACAYFRDKIAAAKFYDEQMTILYGPFARTNKSMGLL